MKNLLEVRDAVGDALVALGDGNWKMGAGVGVAKTSKLGVGSEQILIEHYICALLQLSSVPFPRIVAPVPRADPLA
jgi:hypothetical protein